MKSIKTPKEDAVFSLQPLLGTCKHNPLFSILHDKQANLYLLYYGAELLETFPDVPAHFAFRLSAGRLYNAGVKRSSLCEAFGLDIRTIARIGKAMSLPDPDELMVLLRGRQRPRKLTPEIQCFIREMMETAFELHPQAPSRYLREMVLKVYKVSLSAETIRPLLADYRKKKKTQETPYTQTACDSELKSSGSSQEENTIQAIENESVEDFTAESALPKPPETDRKRSACFPEKMLPRFLPHAGLAVFLPMLKTLKDVDEEDGGLLQQWAAGILLGAVNIEQTKTLDYASLETFLGPIRFKSPSPLRQELYRIARRSELRASLLKFNAQMTGHTAPSHVYFDPHTKLYTGKEPILFGWIASSKRVDKAHHGDWFHGSDGFPLWHQLCDNYDDMRTRFVPAFRQMRSDLNLPCDEPLCVVVDRGIHGLDSFDAIRKEPGLCVLTWDQSYKLGDESPPAEGVSHFDLLRLRNHSRDEIVIHLEAWESPHPLILGAARVVFRTITSDGEVLKEAAILNLGVPINVKKAVEWMCFRWLQENDFKYQTDHFGLNELTSYTTIPYAEIAGELEDRPVPNAVRKALLAQNAELQKELGKVLIAARKGKKDAAKVLKTLKSISQQLQSAETSKSFDALRKQADKAIKQFDRFFERAAQKQGEAGRIDQERARIQRELKKLPSEVSRLESLIQAEKVRHDFVAKEFFDTIKMIARNMFCLQLRCFRKHYDNLRDDHVLLRDFTRSPGTLIQGSERELLLHPGFMSSRRKLQASFTNYLEEITTEHAQNPYKNIRLVASKDAFELAMHSDKNTL
jgi:hypothetical protein